ncbi:hypothetical protein OG897_21780 [Streptomyces sp. NBC_00237]|uniref:hypothetical protein n=1 Tax=Streptomyces sp. NBC_00237 TaxID=2975687 RepID=UPI00224F304A|nr:hypothetical protein [Streptomyces sp. NBC_00237]MCX5204070.1 hypothetical protein [Streptomyces sp. NBC_00237]
MITSSALVNPAVRAFVQALQDKEAFAAAVTDDFSYTDENGIGDARLFQARRPVPDC